MKLEQCRFHEGLGSGTIVNYYHIYYCFYANSFVGKNRSKELGLYSMLGLNRFHLFVMVVMS